MQAIYDYDPEWGEPSTLSTSIGEIVGCTPEACMLRSGDMVLMDAKVFHFGGANESPRRRFLLQFSFIGPGIFGSHTSRPPEFTYHLDSSAGEQHIYHSYIYQCAFILRPVAYYFLDQLTARSGSWEAARAFCVQHVLEGYSELNKNKASKPTYRRNFYGSVLNILNLEPNITTS